MRTSFITTSVAAVLIAVALPKHAEPSGRGDSKLPRTASRGELDGNLTIEQALSLAEEMNPSLVAGTRAVSAARARVTQAGLLPNPKLELESENFGGSGNLDGFNSAETTAVISQPVLLGGKRSRRRALAESEQSLAGRDLEAIRLDLTAATTSAFYRVLAAQQRETLADELLSLAERFAHSVQKRVDAGKVSPVEASRASIEVAQARVGLARAMRELEATRVLLAATWGASTASFDQVVGELPEPSAPPSLRQLRSLLLEAPEITRLEDLIKRQQRVLQLESSFRIPDLTVSVGPRRFEETGESAWVTGISLPIPIFDRNQGARRAAEFDLERTRRDADAVRVGLEAQLASAHAHLQAVTLEAIAMGEEIVPAAEAAFAAAEIGYREGKFGFLDVLDAQRSLFDARSLLLDSREEYAMARTELERLTGFQATSQAGAQLGHPDTSLGEEQ